MIPHYGGTHSGLEDRDKGRVNRYGVQLRTK